MKILLSSILLFASALYAQTELVKVTEVTEITKPYTQKIKIGEQCYEDTVEVDVSCGDADTNSIGVDTIIGTTIGIAIGNQIGRGSGNDAAKIIGGILGATTANRMREKTCKSYETVTRCTPKYEYKTTYKTVGYNNCAMVDGQKLCKQTKEPIEYLRIKKTITVY